MILIMIPNVEQLLIFCLIWTLTLTDLHNVSWKSIFTLLPPNSQQGTWEYYGISAHIELGKNAALLSNLVRTLVQQFDIEN